MLANFESAEYDSCYVYEVGTKHIAFYCKDGAVSKLKLEDLIDSQLLN